MLEETSTRSGRLISDADSVPPAWDDDDNGGAGRRRKSSGGFSLLLPRCLVKSENISCNLR